MSKHQAVSTASMATLSHLIGLLEAHPTLGEITRKEMISAIRTMARILKTESHLLPAVPAELRVLINSALPAAFGMSDARWRNIKSLVRRSLALFDPAVMPARSRAVLLPAWSALLAEPAAKPLERGLARFSKYCSEKDVVPQAVTQGLYDTFYTDLAAHCIMRSPRETQQAAGKAWNAARATVPGWPDLVLKIQNFRKNPSLPWSGFPPSMQDEVEAYLAKRSDDDDLLDDTPKLRESTIEGKRRQFRQFITAVVESGREPASLRSLSDLVDPQVAKAGLQVLIKRTGEQRTSRNQSMAHLLLSIARHQVVADEATLKALAILCKNVAPKNKGMTPKCRHRLAQFDDARCRDNLLGLPKLMMEEACKVAEPTLMQARTAQLAIAINLLLMAPMRIRNISELELGRTLFLDGKRAGRILIDGSEVKNDYDIEIPLPRVLLERIDIYLKRFHPLLAPSGCRMLFPSNDGGHKRTTVLSNQITVHLRQRIGVAMHCHLFRHLAAKLYLEAFPGSYPIVQILLGHKDINTTIRTYAGTEHAAVFRMYDEFITGLRGEGHDPTPPVRFGRRIV